MYCEKCKVTVRGRYSRCPLCQQKLTGKPTDNVFPRVDPPAARLRFFLRFALFLSVVAAVISVALNVAMPEYGRWSVFVIAGLGSLWLSVSLFLKKKDNIHKAIIWQVALISALAVVWDVLTGFRGWSVDFVIPILCTAAMIAMAIIAQAIRLKIQDYMIYMIIDAVWGVLCILLIVFNITNIILPALICVCGSVISLAALFIFEGRALSAELRRRMHL